MGAWSLALPLLKHTVPLPRLGRLMWRRAGETAVGADVDRIVTLARWAARFRPLPGRDNCLERSLIAYRYLSAANADPRLVVGVRRLRGRIDGHVWIEVDGVPLHESESVIEFEPVVALGAGGARVE
jgi:hypothetical protein